MKEKQLPNQSTTWEGLSEKVEEFEDWRDRQTYGFACERTEITSYLTDQISREGEELAGVRLNNPPIGLINYMSSKNNRLKELMTALLCILAGDEEPANKLIRGVRLTPGLHPEYVNRTHCYE